MYEEIKEILKKTLSKRRYTHSLGVAEEAKRLAGLYGADEKKAYLAGLLHDCAKETDNPIKRCEELDVPLDDIMRSSAGLIHGPLGAEIARLEFGIADEEIHGAIRWHTVGKADMTLLEKIIYIADMTEQNRDFDGVAKLRRAVDRDLDEAILISIEEQFKRLSKTRRTIHPNTVCMWNDLISNKERGAEDEQQN